MNAIQPTDQICKAHLSWWLGEFEKALHAGDRDALLALFAEESHWRDMLAFTWNVTPHDDPVSIVDDLIRTQPSVQARNFQIAAGRTPPRQLKRLGVSVFEAIISFETEQGRCHGVLRLPVDQPQKAWIFATSLTELKGHEEPIGPNRPTGSAYSRNFGGANWLDLREREQ
ncbi:MAG: hypothetical protein QM605_05675, partial [Sphingobium sp.]